MGRLSGSSHSHVLTAVLRALVWNGPWALLPGAELLL